MYVYSVVAATVDQKYCGYRNPCTPLVLYVCTYIYMYVCTYCRDGQLRYTYIQYVCYHTEGWTVITTPILGVYGAAMHWESIVYVCVVECLTVCVLGACALGVS